MSLPTDGENPNWHDTPVTVVLSPPTEVRLSTREQLPPCMTCVQSKVDCNRVMVAGPPASLEVWILTLVPVLVVFTGTPPRVSWNVLVVREASRYSWFLAIPAGIE